VALALFILWSVAELLVAIVVANAIGVLQTIILLIAAWPLGTWALRSQGRAAWNRLAAAIAEGRAPAHEVVDGALVLVGGALLIVPGFITDVIGIGLLLPPTRALMRPLLVRNLRSRLVLQAVRRSREPFGYDVESTARDVDQPRLRP
jgi:UPF0716 protein FxsA